MEFSNDSWKVFIKGPLQIIFSSACFAFMSYFAKLATYDIPSSEVTFFRLVMGTLVTLVLVAAGRVTLISENSKLLIVRGFLGGVAVLLFFMALEKGTITNSNVLQNTYPIFAALFSLYILKEKVSFRVIAFIMISFLGIVILIRPDIENIKVGDIFALVSGLLAGFTITAIRQLRRKNESVWTIFFYFCSFGSVLSLLLAVPNWTWPQPEGYVLLFLTGLLGLLGQVTMTSAYKYCTTAVGGILSMSTSVFSFLIGILLLDERMSGLDLVGIFLIIAGNVMVVAFKEVGTTKQGEQAQFFHY